MGVPFFPESTALRQKSSWGFEGVVVEASEQMDAQAVTASSVPVGFLEHAEDLSPPDDALRLPG